MEPDDGPWEVCAALAAVFRNPDGTDRWRVWPGAGNGLFYAWYINTAPPVVLRDRNLAGLKQRMVKFEVEYEATQSVAQALAAAERLET